MSETIPNPPEYSSLPSTGNKGTIVPTRTSESKTVPSTIEPNRPNKSAAPIPPKQQLFKKRLVKAVYDFKSEDEEDLNFKMGDLIEVLDASDQYGWWVGKDPTGKRGNFPSNYVMEQ